MALAVHQSQSGAVLVLLVVAMLLVWLVSVLFVLVVALLSHAGPQPLCCSFRRYCCVCSDSFCSYKPLGSVHTSIVRSWLEVHCVTSGLLAGILQPSAS